MPEAPDITRLRIEYADRESRLKGSDIYSPFNQANLFIRQQRQREVLRLLRRTDFYPLSKRSILEIGCGTGGVLLEYLEFGASPALLHGIDLLPDRMAEAHQCLPQLLLTCADGQYLPYPDGCFDLVMQYTVHSSILDDMVKQRLSAEMLRVIKLGGMILWYDFWLNPTNHQTQGIRPAEIRRLFPHCTYEFHKITLAPPVARRVVPVSWIMALFLEKLEIFNSHYLAAIRPVP